jgi:tRNA (guanine-N7-)-methyltransferase
MRLKFLPSFVKRRGRITKNQEENLKFLSDFSINNIEQIRKEATHYSYCCLEIGFGNADHLQSQALENPDTLFVGSEVYMSGIGTLIGAIKEKNINNIKIFPDDIRILLDDFEGEGILDAVKILCPDPWPKERHHKRRLINNDFLRLINRPMKDQATIYVSTDWENYAESIKAILNASSYFEPSMNFFLKKEYLTKFELRGQNEGRVIFEFNYHKKG